MIVEDRIHVMIWNLRSLDWSNMCILDVCCGYAMLRVSYCFEEECGLCQCIKSLCLFTTVKSKGVRWD